MFINPATIFFEFEATQLEDINKMIKKYKIEGIYCAMGVVKIQKKLKTIDSVEDAKFDLKTGIATVEGNPIDSDVLNAVDDAGFKASVMEV